jgi:hypothetical protein
VSVCIDFARRGLLPYVAGQRNRSLSRDLSYSPLTFAFNADSLRSREGRSMLLIDVGCSA